MTTQEELEALVDKHVARIKDPALTRDWTNLKEMTKTGESSNINTGIEQPIINFLGWEVRYLPKAIDPERVINTGDGGGLRDYSSGFIEAAWDELNIHITLPSWYNLFMKNRPDITKKEDFFRILADMEKTGRVHFVRDDLFAHADHVYQDTSLGLDKIDIRMAYHYQKGVIQRIQRRLKARHPNTPILHHCNDWFMGMIPAALKEEDETYTVMVAHSPSTKERKLRKPNEHGLITKDFFQYLWFTTRYPSGKHTNNFDNEVCLLSSGLNAADGIITVSPTFLEEMAHNEPHIQILPHRVHEIVARRVHDGEAAGVLNGYLPINDAEFDPYAITKYSPSNAIAGQRANKTRFQEIMGLNIDGNAPILYWPHRLSDPQKGTGRYIAEIVSLLDDYAHIGLQIAFVANGPLAHQVYSILEDRKDLQKRLAIAGFDMELSQLGKSACDLLMFPSLWEPSGIPQLEPYAMLTVARATGGLINSVDELSEDGTEGNGFLFNEYKDMRATIDKAIAFTQKPDDYRQEVIERVMQQKRDKFNFGQTVDGYIPRYQAAMGHKVH